MSSIPIPETTLSSRAMLCTLSIAQWSASKHDRQASEEIAAHHGAQPDVGRYNKLLIPKETLAEVRRIAGEARREHYFMILPWDDNGYRSCRQRYTWSTQKNCGSIRGSSWPRSRSLRRNSSNWS